MRTRRVTFLAAIALLLLALGGAWLWTKVAYPTYSYRFRLVVEVDVDGATKAGSSVLEVRIRKQPNFSSPVYPFIFGEAVYVDLGAKGHVIVLLGFGPDGSIDRLGTLATRQFGLTLEDKDLKRLPTMRGKAELWGEDIPTLVTFRDPSDPNTARVVRPELFETVFGPGVRLSKVWIEMTDGPITRNVVEKLPWWQLPGRPAGVARRAWLNGQIAGSAVEPERLFVKP